MSGTPKERGRLLKIDRFILNFAHKCSMNCEWCYVPFGDVPAEEKTVVRVVDRMAEAGFKFVTIGGGDPFQYKFISSVIMRAREKGLFVHVDSHGKSLRKRVENEKLIKECVDLLGLPLDGGDAISHDLMRGEDGHFYLIMDRLDWLIKLGVKIKINTVVSAKNSAGLGGVAELISRINPSRWSVYEYWPLGPAQSVEGDNSLPEGEFLRATGEALEVLKGGGTEVEINPMESRRKTYPIVHHDGMAFIHDDYPVSDFREIGSVFSDDTLSTIDKKCFSERIQAKTRYVDG